MEHATSNAAGLRPIGSMYWGVNEVVTEETEAASAVARRSRHDGVAGLAAAPPPKTCSPNSCNSSADSLQGSAAKSCFEMTFYFSGWRPT